MRHLGDKDVPQNVLINQTKCHKNQRKQPWLTTLKTLAQKLQAPKV
jgi:hypothetical protein